MFWIMSRHTNAMNTTVLNVFIAGYALFLVGSLTYNCNLVGHQHPSTPPTPQKELATPVYNRQLTSFLYFCENRDVGIQ